MKTTPKTQTATIQLGERELLAEWYTTKYYPAVFYLRNGDPGYPAEGGEVEITALTEDGVDIFDSLSDADMNKVVDLLSEIDPPECADEHHRNCPCCH